MTSTSVLVPAVGLITAPLLARALGADGRGSLAAAMAPAALILGVATLGLPDALTYFLAKDPSRTRRAIVSAALVTLLLGGACLLLSVVTAPFFSNGQASLASLIVLASALTIPALVVNVLRGAAAGRQKWSLITMERVIGAALRILALGVLFATGHLTVLTALLVLTLGPVVSAISYLKLFRRGFFEPPADARTHARMGNLLVYGSRVWLGSVASMLLSRSDQLLMVPLSSTRDLGLYIVASTISDVPIVVSLAVQSAVFGVNSASPNASHLARTSRVVTLAALLGCGVIAITLPLWIGLLFGRAFEAATIPTLLLLAGSVVCVPGLIASAGISAWGRPGLRSLGLLGVFVTNLVTLILLVPQFGAVGAAVTAVVSNILMTSYMTVAAGRMTRVRALDFVLIKREDFGRITNELQILLTTIGGVVRRTR